MEQLSLKQTWEQDGQSVYNKDGKGSMEADRRGRDTLLSPNSLFHMYGDPQ